MSRAAVMATTVRELLEESAFKFSKMDAIVDPASKQRLTYSHLLIAIDMNSKRLLDHAVPGKRIAIIEESGFDLSLWLLAIMFRHTVIPINPGLSDEEVLNLVSLTNCEFISTHSMTDRAKKLATASHTKFIDLSSKEEADFADDDLILLPTSESVAAVLLTSGSTGTPKVVPLSQGNLTYSAREVADSISLMPGDRVLALWAQFHIGGLVDLLLAPLATGGEIIAAGTFSLEKFRVYSKSLRPSWIQVVPTTLSEILQQYQNKKEDLSDLESLRLFRCVAAPIDPGLIEAVERELGCLVVHTYGMTEASPFICSTPTETSQRIRGSVGQINPTRVKIANPKGEKLSQETLGNIFIRGNNVFRGYESKNSQTENQHPGGWFNTGDIGLIDSHGNLFVIGRQSNIINRGGEKINLMEVEKVINRHPAVEVACVFAFPHPRLGDIPIVAIVKRAEITLSQLRSYLSLHLASYKHPEDLFLIDKLPTTAIGKVDTVTLKQKYENKRTSEDLAFDTKRDPLVEEVLGIWSRVLGVEVKSIDLSFVAAGGDSLSALRVALKIEEKFGVSLSDSELARLSSVRELASHIMNSAMFSGSRKKHKFTEGLELSEANRYRIGSLEQGLKKLLEPGTVLKRNELVATMLESFTPSEVEELLRETPEDWGINWESLIPEAGRRIIEIEGESPSLNNWQRQTTSDYSVLYTRHDVKNAPRSLIAFTGNANRLMLPIFQVLSCLPSSIKWVLLVSDPTKNWFLGGSPGVADSLTDLGPATLQLLPAAARGNVSTLGVSSGYLAALVTGHAIGASSIGLIAPRANSRTSINSRLPEKIHEKSQKVPRVRIASGLKLEDLKTIAGLMRKKRGIKLRLFPTFTHNVMRYSLSRGSIRNLLAWLT